MDLLCAFVKWYGLRLLEDQLRELKNRGVPIRVLTTTYMGATDAKALDALVNEFGAEVKVNYETNRTRLHAKAWMFERRSGFFHTAYVGSSNLSRAALVDGLEWNVRLSAIDTPDLMEKFEATFESYWQDKEFVTYDPREHGRCSAESSTGPPVRTRAERRALSFCPALRSGRCHISRRCSSSSMPSASSTIATATS